jgi:hypothetical protein
LRLACRIAGKSAFIFALAAPAGLMASIGEVSELRLDELSGDDDPVEKYRAVRDLVWQ